MPAGRPPKFKTPEAMQKVIDAYFDSCWDIDEDGKRKQTRPYTITGLALALGMSRRALLDYEKKDEFLPTIKRAKLIVENWVEEQLYRKTQVTGAIFNLKNNYGWKDKNETDITSDGKPLVLPQSLFDKFHGTNSSSD